MKYKGSTIFIVLFVILPQFVSAACSNDGLTVVYVNGILTSRDQAFDNMRQLEGKLPESLQGEHINVISGYNPSHINGGGDLLESISQAFGKPISDYDLKTILMQIHSDITTQKIFIVGHSQGAFYANELYDYLTTHGVPKQSIAVYEIATPASFVAGGGGYVTSTNDKVINAVRDREIGANVALNADSHYVLGDMVASTLRANITIPKEPDWNTNQYGGHSLTGYLDGAGDRIVSDMQNELRNLKSDPSVLPADGCFVPPANDFSYKTQFALLSVADSLANGISSTKSGVASGALALRSGISGAFASAASSLQNAFGFNPASQVSAAAAALPEPTIAASLIAPAPAYVPPPQPRALAPAPLQQTLALESTPATPFVPSQTPQPQVPPLSPSNVSVIPFSQLQGISPGFGGGGSGGSSGSSQSQSNSSSNASTQNQASVSLSISSPADQSLFATTSVSVSGTASAGASVLVHAASASTFNVSTITDASGTWNLVVSLTEGTTSLALSAVDAFGNASATTTISVTTDTTPPAATTLSVVECTASLVSGLCVIPASNAHLAWSPVSDAAYYGIAKDGAIVATTTVLAATQSLASNATTTFAIVSYDAVGNTATSSSVDVAAISQPITINEIGWGGDGSDPSHQWIELQNNSPYTLDLSHVSIGRSSGNSIELSGMFPISANNKWLVVEPVDIPFTGSNKLVVPFAALSTGNAEQLSLVWSNGISTTTLDSTPAPSTCTSWCAGSANAKLGSNAEGRPDLMTPLSMERVANAPDGTLASSWQNTDSYGPYTGATGATLWGTPSIANSKGHPDAGIICSGGLLAQTGAPGPSFSPGSGCGYLSRFVTGGAGGSIRYGALYEGDVASSTNVTSHNMGKGLAYGAGDTVPSGTPAGTHFFFAIWEQRTGPIFNFDSFVFNFYFTQGASTTQGIAGPPHGNYAIFPFVYQP